MELMSKSSLLELLERKRIETISDKELKRGVQPQTTNIQRGGVASRLKVSDMNNTFQVRESVDAPVQTIENAGFNKPHESIHQRGGDASRRKDLGRDESLLHSPDFSQSDSTTTAIFDEDHAAQAAIQVKPDCALARNSTTLPRNRWDMEGQSDLDADIRDNLGPPSSQVDGPHADFDFQLRSGTRPTCDLVRGTEKTWESAAHQSMMELWLPWMRSAGAKSSNYGTQIEMDLWLPWMRSAGSTSSYGAEISSETTMGETSESRPWLDAVECSEVCDWMKIVSADRGRMFPVSNSSLRDVTIDGSSRRELSATVMTALRKWIEEQKDRSVFDNILQCPEVAKDLQHRVSRRYSGDEMFRRRNPVRTLRSALDKESYKISGKLKTRHEGPYRVKRRVDAVVFGLEIGDREVEMHAIDLTAAAG